MNRRKLGTSRRSKGKQRVNHPETQPDDESREGVQDEARRNERPETRVSATKQPEVQEEVAQESERDMTAPQVAFLVSATTAEYSEDKTGMLCPEEVKHILDSKGVDMQPFKDETKLEVTESSNTLQNEEVNENLHDRLPDLTSLSASASDQQMISKQAEDFNLCSVAEINSSKLDDSDLFRQDGRLQGNFSVCESRVNTAIAPQITADNAFRENIKINDGVEQETFLFQAEELPTSKDNKHWTPKVRHAKLSQEVENNQSDQNKLTQEQVGHEKDNSTEDLQYDHKDCSSYFENQKSESDGFQSLFLVKSTAVKQDVLTATKETSLDQMDQSGSLVEDNIQTLPSVFKATTETPLHHSSLTTDDHTKAGSSTGTAKRKFGSSRKNKGRHVKDSEQDISENTLNNESLETPTVLSEIKETGNKVVSDVTTAHTILSFSNEGSVCLVPPNDLSSAYPEPDTHSLILTSESLQKAQDKMNSEISAQMFENSDISLHEVDQSEILHSENAADSLSEDVPRNLQEVEFHPTQMQEILQIQHPSEIIPDYVAEHFENISENLNDPPEMSESANSEWHTENITTKQQEHQTEENIQENILEYTHNVEQKSESYELYYANSLQISNLEKSNSTPTQVYEFKKGVEDDMKLTADQNIGEENPVLFDSQLQETSGIVDEQTTKGFYSSANRRKLGAGRKSRGKQDKDSEEEVKDKTSDEETTQILDTKIMSQEEVRIDILPVSYDSSILSIFAPGRPLEDPENLIPGSVNIPDSQENSETDINMDLSDKSWGETLGHQSDTHKSKSGSLQTKTVPDSDVDMRKGQEHMALQEPEPQQLDYTVAGQVEKVGVFVEDTKHDPSNPLLQCNFLSTNKQNDTGFSGSRRKLGSNKRKKGRQQGEIPKQEVLESTRPTMLIQEELTEDSEPRATTSVSNSPLDQSFKELSCVPTKYSETELEDISVNSEHFQKNQNESKLDTENTVDVSQRAVDEFEDNLDVVAGDKIIMDGKHSDNTVKQDLKNEDPLKDLKRNLELDYISEIVAHDIPKYPETVLGGLVDRAEVISNIHSEHTMKSTEDSATKHKLTLIENQQNMCFIAEGNLEALDQTSKDGHLCDSQKTLISSPLGIATNLGQMDTGGSLVEGSEHNPTETNLQDTSLITDERIDADFSFKGNKRKLGSSRRKKGRQDVNESKQEVLGNNAGEKAIDTLPVLLKVKTSEQEELSKASEEEIFWSDVLSSEDQTSEVTEGPDTHLEGLIMECENHQEDVDKRNVNVLVQDVKQSEDLSLSQYKALTEDTRDAGLEDVMVEHPEEVYSITMQDSLQMGYHSETSTNINKTFDLMSENLTEQNERSQLTVKANDCITEKQEECPTEEMTSETLDAKSGGVEQDDTKPKVDLIFDEDKEGMFCEMEKNKPVLSDFQIETVSLDPKPQESSESTEEQINTAFSSSASRRKLGSSRKGKARRQVNDFRDEVNEKTRVDEVDETHRTTQISLDTKTISHEEKRQNTEQDATLLVSNDNSFSVFTCGDSSEVQDPKQKYHPEVELGSLIQEIVNCPENQNQFEFLQSKDKTLQNKEVMSPKHSDYAVTQAHEHDNTPTDIERSVKIDSSSETVTRGVDTHSSIFAPGHSSEFQSSTGNNQPETDWKSLTQKNKPGDHDGINVSDNSEEYSLLDKSEFLQCKDMALQNKVIGGELSDNAAKRAQENEDLPTNTGGNLEMDYTPETVAHDVPKYPETALEGVIDQAEVSSKIHSELTLKHTADSGTEQELLPSEDQQNLCSTTEENLEALNQTCKNDHMYDSKETSISGPTEVHTTLSYMDEGGTLEEGSEHNSNIQDGSVSTNEQTNDGFSFNGNRRKLGSSRRKKGRPDFKESKEEVFENYRSDETPQTSTISVETRGSELEEMSEDIEHKIILSLSQDLSSVSPHILSSENQISVLKNDSDANLQILIHKNEHFGDKGERKLETEVEMIEKSMNVLHQEVGQSDTVHSKDTRDAEPEDALREVEKIEFNPTQMQESIHIEGYSETVVGNVSENEEVNPENLTDQTAMSELTVKATNDSEIKEDSEKKNYPENFSMKNEDSGMFDNNKPQVTDLEKTNSDPTEMNEFEGRVSDDAKPNTGFVVNLEMEGLCEMKENSSAWLNAQTDMVSFDSQSHEFSQNLDGQLNKGIYNTSNRRKLGSSRKIKGRHQVKESTEEGKENTWGDETLNISETKMAGEELQQDLLSPDSSVLAPGNSSDVQSSMLNNYSETDLKSLIQESHSEDQDESETGNVKLSHKSKEDTLLDKSDVQESNDQILQSNVTGSGCSDNAEKQAEEHENLPADIEICLQMDYTSETVAHDISTHPESDLGNVIDQAEIINNSQPDLTTKNYPYSNTKEELLHAEGQQNLCFTTQGNVKASDQTSQDEHIFDSKETSISNPVGVNSTLSQMGEGGILVENTTENPTETKHEDNSLATNEQTDAGLHGSRRKLGSSRRKKGRQQHEGSQEEVLENTNRDETFEMPKMSLEMKAVEKEEQREETKHEMILSVSRDSSMSLIPPAISSHDRSTSVPTNYPDEVVQSLTLKNENLHEDTDDRKSDVFTSDEAKQSVFHGDPRNAVSENVHEEVHSIQIQDSVQTNSDKIFADDATENVDTISRALTDKTEESEINTNSIDDITSIQEACPSKEIISAAPGLKNEETIQQDVQPNADHIVNRNNEGLFLQMEENKFALSNLQSENVSSGSHPLESSERVEEQTKVDVHSRRKLGSSRRNKGRGNAKDIGQPITEVNLNASMNELGERTTETVAQDRETLMGIVLAETEESDSSQTKDSNISTSFCMTGGMQLSPIVDQEDSDTSCCMKITDRELPKHHSRDHDEYRELQDGNLQESAPLPEPHAGPPPAELRAEKNSSCEQTEPERGDGDAFKKVFEQETKPEQNQKMLEAAEKERDDIPEYHEAFSRNLFSENENNAMKTEILQPDKNAQSEQLSQPPERTTEKGNSMENVQVVYCNEQNQGTVSSPQEMFYTDGEEHRHIILSRAAETHYLHDIQSKEQKEQNKTGQMQEMHQISFPIDDSLRETMQSDKDVTLDSHPQDNYKDLKDDAHRGFKASENRRKLGSSRRTKGRKHGQVNEQNQENKDDALENTGDETTKILAGRQKELENFIQPNILATFSSPVTENLLEENTVSSHDVLEDNTIAKSDFNTNSRQENSIKSSEETRGKDAKRIEEAEDWTQLTGHDTNKLGLMQSGQNSVLSSDSDMQSILFHDGPKSESVYVIDKEEALQRQKREALSCEKDPPGAKAHLKETNKEIETAGFITTEVCSSLVESSMDLKNPTKGEVEGNYMYARMQKNTSNEFVSASQEPAMDASYEGGISTTVNPLENRGEKPQETSKQKKRKIGSSRRTPLNRKRDGERHEIDEAEESDIGAKAEMTNLSAMEVVGKVLVNEEVLQGKDVQPQQEASLQQETLETETGDRLQSSNMSLVFPPEQSATIDLILETSKPDDFANSQTQICSEDTERNNSSLNQPVSSNTGTLGGSVECTQGDERSPESIKVSQVQEQMPSTMTESIHSQNPGVRNESLDLTPTNRRRKMGSTRKNLGTRTKQEILEMEKESTNTVLSSGEATEASVSGRKETELQLHTEHTDDNTYQEKQKETVEISPFGESLLRALADEEKVEESSISQTQTAETRRQWDPSGLSASPSNDGTSESAFGGRRKKFGSNRKSALQQRKPDPNAQNEDEAGGLTEGSVVKATEREESSGLRKISEVDENGQKPSSSTNISEATGSSRSMRDETPVKPVHRNIRLGQESGSQLSFGTTSGADKSDGYNVVMIGESCVGKTSFMKRAQSGKFSLDIPPSVGLDSCKWTVVVDGKPVVLQLWDTAGQERFHSITRQVFHKAQAFLLMYDITSSQSFSAISYWANSIQEAAAEDVTVLLLGNKSEHARRQVKTEQGDILAKEYNFEFMECSAATGENVIEALETVARMLSQRADLVREEATVLYKEPAQRKSSKCC